MYRERATEQGVISPTDGVFTPSYGEPVGRMRPGSEQAVVRGDCYEIETAANHAGSRDLISS